VSSCAAQDRFGLSDSRLLKEGGYLVGASLRLVVEKEMANAIE
jgi:hypothetical protein